MLTIYPAIGYDSFASVLDIDELVTKYSVKNAEYLALDDTSKERFIRITTDRIIDVIDLTKLPTDATPACIKKAVALMVVKDLTYNISEDAGKVSGNVTKERHLDTELTYAWSSPDDKLRPTVNSPFVAEVITCLNSYGASINSIGVNQPNIVLV